MGIFGGSDNVVLESGTKRHIKFRTVLLTMFVCFGSMCYGYAAGVTGVTLGQPSFLEYMGLLNADNAASLIGAMNALFFTGGFIAVVFNGWLNDKYGRKLSLIIGAVLVLISAALLAGSVNIAMFIAFRFVSGFGAYMLVMTVPLWITETVPPYARGMFGLCHGMFVNLGFLISSYIGVGFYLNVAPTPDVWRGPLAIGVAPPLILLLGIYWIPESPRFLVMKGKDEEAWEIVKSLHSSDNDKEHEYAQKEVFQMRKQTELDRTLNSLWGEIFRRPSYRKRAFMAIVVVFTIISSGGQVIASYGTILFSDLGYDTNKQLFLEAGLYMMSTFGHPLALFYIDRVPRQRLISVALLILMAVTVVYTGLTSHYLNTDNSNAQAAAVAMTYIYFFFYGASVDAPTFVYCSELFPMHLRGKGMTFGMAGYALSSLIWVMAGPTAIANIKWGFFMVMILITFVGACIIWTFPDTKGKTLEEVAAIFGDDDLVVVYQRDIHLDRKLHQVTADISYSSGKSLTTTELHEHISPSSV